MTFWDPPQNPIVPPRINSAWEDRLALVGIPVANETQLRTVITQLIANPATTSAELCLTDHITLSRPLVIAPPSGSTLKIIINGNNRFRIQNKVAQTNLISASCQVIFKNLIFSDKAATTDQLDLQADGCVIDNCVFTTTATDGYCINLNSNNFINVRDCVVEGTGSYVGFIRGGSDNSTFSGISITNTCSTLLAPSTSTSDRYINCYFQNIDANNASMPGFSGALSVFTGIRNLSSITYAANTGEANVWVGTNASSITEVAGSGQNYYIGMSNASPIGFQLNGGAVIGSLSGSAISSPLGVFSEATNLNSISFPDDNALIVMARLSNSNNVQFQDKVYGETLSTTDATPGSIFQFTTSTAQGYLIEADVVGRRTNNINETNAYKLMSKAKNNGGTLTLGTVSVVYSQEEVAGYDATIDTSGTTIRIRATGSVGHNVEWSAKIRIQQI